MVQSYASIQCWDLSGLRPQRSQFPGSNCCTSDPQGTKFNLRRLRLKARSAPAVWNAVLAA